MASILNGKFVWYELTTPDAPAARRFYGDVLGWDIRDGGIPGLDYSLASAAGTDVAGIMGQQDGMPVHWLGYVCVDDIDAAYAKAAAAGAATYVTVAPIPGVGRFSILADPNGAPFGLLEYAEEFPKPALPAHGIHGHGWWRELHTSDCGEAFDFYSEQFGWTQGTPMDMGPMGFYHLLIPAEGKDAHGGLLKDGGRPPFWLLYFWVDDIDAAAEKVGAGGGTVVNGPMEVPGGVWVIEGRDPQGVTFALVGARQKK